MMMKTEVWKKVVEEIYNFMLYKPKGVCLYIYDAIEDQVYEDFFETASSSVM